MIVKNEREQYLQCTICGEMTELRRRTLANWETVQLLIEELGRDHEDCEEYADDPQKAALERGYKVRMRDAMTQRDARRRRPCRTHGRA